MKTPDNKMMTGAQTKGDELTPEEVAWLKNYVARKSGDWPRKMDFAGAVNVAPPTSDLVAKSARHLQLEADLEAAQASLTKVMELIREQEREYLAKSQISGEGSATFIRANFDKFEPFSAPATTGRVEIEARITGIRARLHAEENKYRARQRRAILGIPEPNNLVDRGLAALGLK